jgi:hypothetical protein
MKKGNRFLPIVFIFFCTFAFAQNKNSRPVDGSCWAVMRALRELHGNDSVAFERFKADYEITNLSVASRDSLFRKNYVEAIRYFDTKKDTACFCRSRIIEIKIQEQRNHFFLLM